MKGSLSLALCAIGLGWLFPSPSTAAVPPTAPETVAGRSSSFQIAQAIAVTDIEVMPTVNGLTLNLVSDQPLSVGNTRTVGDALVIDVPGATLALSDLDAAEQFSPADGIALVQVSSSPSGVEVRITGTEGPPTVDVISTTGGISLAVEPGVAAAEADTEAINLFVTATRTEEDVLNVPRSITIINREEIDQQRQLTSNLVDILGKLVPGLGPPTLQSSVRAQSLRGRVALILIDGVPQNPNSNFFTELNTVDIDLIDRIEIVRGPSAIYGDGATGGIINIITRSATDQPVEFDLGASVSTGLSRVTEDGFSYGLKAGVAGSGDRLDGRLLLSYDITNSFFDADGDRIPPNGVADTDRFGLLGKVGYNFTDEQRLELTYNYYSEDLDNTEFVTDRAVLDEEDPEKARSIRVGEVDYEEDPQQINHVVNLTYRHENLLSSQFDAQLYFRDTELRQRFADLRGNTFGFPELWQTSLDSTEWGARLQFDTNISDRFSVVWGADYGREENSRPVLISDVATFEESNALRIVDRRGQTPDFDITTLGLFAQATWEINDQLQLSGGLRYDNFDVSVEDTILAFDRFNNPLREGGDIDADDVSFNVGVIYSPAPQVSLFANFAQGFSIPEIGINAAFNVPREADLSDDFSLEPQQVDSFEIGARVEFGRIQASLSGFYNESELGNSLIVNDDGFAEFGRAPQRNYGFEATLDWQPSDVWRLGGYVSWNEGEFENEDGDFVALSTLEVQPIKVGFYIENDTTSTWTNRLQLLAVGNRDRAFDDEVDAFEAEGYITFDLISSLKLGPGRLRLGVENLLNNQYIPISSQERFGGTAERRFAAPGIRLTVGYSATF